jgi:hypothetical protein
VVEKTWPTESPADYDNGMANPSTLWQNDCGATEKTCQGNTYFGGHGECAQGHSFWRVFHRDQMHPTTDKVKITGKIWTIDSWDNESFTVDLRNQNGVSLASREYRAQHSSTANG